jgi:hypothetical protein
MYDHNQTLIPDSFLALHSAHGRALLPRDQLEARYELCEDLALHTAAFLATHEQDPDGSDDALRRCLDGLRVEPSAVSAAEAAWVIRRVAELQDWAAPAWLADASPAASS